MIFCSSPFNSYHQPLILLLMKTYCTRLKSIDELQRKLIKNNYQDRNEYLIYYIIS